MDADDPLAPRLQLVEHAETGGHPLCGVCGRSLPLGDVQTCEVCLTESRRLLGEVASMYAELPHHLGHLRSPVYDADRPGADDGVPLPGGDALVLLAGGHEGLAEDGFTSRHGDPVSVAFELSWWAEEWQDARGERVAARRPLSPRGAVRVAVGYLEVHARWAARQHPAFARYMDDLAGLHRRLERATGRTEVTVRAEAECFACGADALVRQVTEAGLADAWTCARCGAVYDWPRYLLACRARVEDGRRHLALVGWGTVRQVAAAVGSPVETVKTWVKRGAVSACCLVESKEQLVWYPDADDRARRRRRGERRAG